MFLGFSFALFPAVLSVCGLIRLWKKGKEKLADEVLPDVSERVGEAVRVRQRRAWEKKHGKHEKT